MCRDPKEGQIDCGPGNLFELPERVGGGIRCLGARSAEESVALKGPGPGCFPQAPQPMLKIKNPAQRVT